MSPCAPWAIRTLSPRPTSVCCAPRVWRIRKNSKRGPSAGVRGARTRRCTYGRRMHMINYTYMESPVGRLLLAGDEDGLRLIGFADGKSQPKPEPEWRYHTEPLQKAVGQLSDYFAGNLRRFDLPL